MRAWTSVVILAGLGVDRPSELIVTSVTRARFCELVGQQLKLGNQCDDLFLLGLFSLIDVLTEQPLEDALTALPLSDEARDALLGRPNRYHMILELARMYERAQWSAADQLIGSLKLRSSHLPSIYDEAVQWGNQSRHLR
jgi:EAL and modified HD-GYP domain-containing signal transduction protein